jgi:uncharacterized protein
MELQKTRRLFAIVLLVFASIPLMPSGAREVRAYGGTTVDEIYNSIRNSPPKYQWEEKIISFKNEGMNLVCTQVIPRTGKKPPIVITFNGFTGDRNDLVLPETGEPFWVHLSRLMAEQGFATLRVDFRGSGDSDGTYGMSSFSTQISDGLAAVEYIHKSMRRQVNKKSIGLFGFSQGGLVASATAAADDRVESVVLWSSVGSPPISYEGLLTREGIKKGLALEVGKSDSFGLYIDGQHVIDVELGREFFYDLFRINPLTEISKYNGPLMAIVGTQDTIVWPQPAVGEAYMKYHDGYEKLVVLDGSHNFNFGQGIDRIDDAIYWCIAWFMKTLD